MEVQVRSYSKGDTKEIHSIFYQSLIEIFDDGKITWNGISHILNEVLLVYYGFSFLGISNFIALSIFSRLLNYFYFSNYILCLAIGVITISLSWIVYIVYKIKKCHQAYLNFYDSALKEDYTNLEEWMVEGEKHLWVANYGTDIVGSIAVKNISSKFKDSKRKVAELKRLFVSSKHGRKGIATKLFNALERWCLENCYTEIHLLTSGFHNEAKSFYTKLGFELKITKNHEGLAGAQSFYFEKNLIKNKIS